MKPYLYTFICLLLTSCISYKKEVLPVKISDINQLPLSTTKPKCIVLKKQREKGVYMPNEYFYFFPEYNIFLSHKTSMIVGRSLGYYHFEKSPVDSNLHLYLKSKNIPTDGIYFEQKSIKKSLDSVYIDVKLATVTRFPFDKYQLFKLEDEKNRIGIDSFCKIDNFSISILLDSADSCEFIIAFKRDSSIKNVNIFTYYHECNIDTIHNFYEVRGTFCGNDIDYDIVSQLAGLQFPRYGSYINNNSIQITKISKNTYEFSQINFADSISIEKTIYTLIDKKSLYEVEKYVYMLPTFIKLLECSAKYPPK